ncbi:MAG: DNA translocase FtsK 4TM domain-containing protein, partial [Bacteroidales bacterium]|nr:DNA translocase FtsK 4TM domain-containing protein [Bacteroidales bacterium]
MKKKTKRSAAKKHGAVKNKEQKPAFSILKNENAKFITGLLITGFAVYILFAFIAYIFWWKSDQSFDISQVISGADIEVKNWSGKSGAWFADLFIRRGFGLAAFFIPVIFASIGLKMLNLKRINAWIISRNMILGTIIVSVSLAYIFGVSDGFLGAGPGGAHGYQVSRWLNSFIGKLGNGILIFVVLTAYLILVFKLSPVFFKKLFIKKPISTEEDLDPDITEALVENSTEAVDNLDFNIINTRDLSDSKDNSNIDPDIKGNIIMDLETDTKESVETE